MSRVAPFVLIVCVLVVAGCGGDSGPTAPTQPRAEYSQTDLLLGTGAAAANGNRLTVDYTGWLYDPTRPEQKRQQFDTSIGGAPFSFVLGSGGVIRGWDQGLVGMRAGGRRRLVIPTDLAYGSAGNGPIPPNAALVFDVDLLGVQ
jgi:FKBP-type peptidyl-prolyl cis-trans isomerase FkpA